MSNHTGKPHNAINGAELALVIGQQVTKKLMEDSRFRQNLVYPQASYRVAASVVCYPEFGKTMDVDVSGVIGTPDPGDPVLAVPPKPDAGMPAAFTREHAIGDGIHHKAAPSRTAPEPFLPATSPTAEADLLNPMAGRGKAPGVNTTTQNGLEITGGAVPRPEGRRDVIAPLDGGAEVTFAGSIDNPNAARREAGLAVPSPQKTAGGAIVDLTTSQQQQNAESF